MKKLLLATSFFCIASPAFSNELSIPDANRVILSEKTEVFYGFVGQAGEVGRWSLNKADTEKANKAIYAFLATAESNKDLNDFQQKEIRKILKNISRYRVQYAGITIRGQKRIWCNFFPGLPNKGSDSFDYWKTEVVQVMDGGYWFWQIEYDIKSDACLNFRSQGYA